MIILLIPTATNKSDASRRAVGKAEPSLRDYAEGTSRAEDGATLVPTALVQKAAEGEALLR